MTAIFDFRDGILSPPWASSKIQQFPYIGAVLNSEDMNELFIELGFRSTVFSLDNQGEPKITGPYKVTGLNRVVEYETALDLRATFLPFVYGNSERPPSFVYADRDGDNGNGDLYRMTAIGVCSRKHPAKEMRNGQ